MTQEHDVVTPAGGEPSGFAPALNIHGDALSDIKTPAGAAGRNAPIVTFVAYRKDNGEAITVDDRTFAPEALSLDELVKVYDTSTGDASIVKAAEFDPATMSREPPVEGT